MKFMSFDLSKCYTKTFGMKYSRMHDYGGFVSCDSLTINL